MKRTLTAVVLGVIVLVLLGTLVANASFQLEYAEGVPRDDGMAVPTRREIVYPLPPRPPAAPVTHQTASRLQTPTRLPSTASGGIWDCIAKYESGGNWSISTGRFEGGLQFLPSTWRAAGGTRYAAHAYQATKAQQIAVAASWLSKTSWAQWPNTSRMCGVR